MCMPQHVVLTCVCVCLMVCAEDDAMESVDSDEGSSNAPKHKPAPQKKTGVQRQQKRGPGRPRKHPSPSDPDKKKALQPRGGITKVSAMPPLALAEHTPSPPLATLFCCCYPLSPTSCFPISLSRLLSYPSFVLSFHHFASCTAQWK